MMPEYLARAGTLASNRVIREVASQFSMNVFGAVVGGVCVNLAVRIARVWRRLWGRSPRQYFSLSACVRGGEDTTIGDK